MRFCTFEKRSSKLVNVTVPLTGVMLPHAPGQFEPKPAENMHKQIVTADTVTTLHDMEKDRRQQTNCQHRAWKRLTGSSQNCYLK